MNPAAGHGCSSLVLWLQDHKDAHLFAVDDHRTAAFRAAMEEGWFWLFPGGDGGKRPEAEVIKTKLSLLSCSLQSQSRVPLLHTHARRLPCSVNGLFHCRVSESRRLQIPSSLHKTYCELELWANISASLYSCPPSTWTTNIMYRRKSEE